MKLHHHVQQHISRGHIDTSLNIYLLLNILVIIYMLSIHKLLKPILLVEGKWVSTLRIWKMYSLQPCSTFFSLIMSMSNTKNTIWTGRRKDRLISGRWDGNCFRYCFLHCTKEETKTAKEGTLTLAADELKTQPETKVILTVRVT